jgi:hypothetical protein
LYASERIQERQKNYGQDYDRQRSEECNDVCMIVERVVVKRMVLIGPMDEAVLSTKNSVQVNNYSIYRALNVRATPFVESQCDMLQRHDDRACKRKPNTRAHQTPRGSSEMFIRFQSGFLYRCHMRSRREPSHHQLCRPHVLLHCMRRSCRWDEETIRKRV